MVMALTDVWSKAETDFASGRYDAALFGYVAVVRAVPRFSKARYRIADALLNVGDRARSQEVYRALAWHYIKAGYPLLGLAVAKMLIALDSTYDDLLHVLAELYSSASDRVGDIDVIPPPSLPEGPLDPKLLDPPAGDLRSEAARLAADTDAVTDVPAKFPLIPIFSHLDETSFARVLACLKLRRFARGELILAEGTIGESFFMVADGVVSVSKDLDGKPTTLARLGHGAVFGEMALVSNAPRVASVRALEDVDLLELSCRDLELHAAEFESVRRALERFTRGRLLANLAATHPLFKKMSKVERRALIGKFQMRKVYPGDIVIEQGEIGKGLCLVLRGEFAVSRTESGATTAVATLGSGDVFGEIALVLATRTTATVRAKSYAEIMVLAPDDFAAMISEYPDVKNVLSQLSEQRIRRLASRAGSSITSDDSTLLL